MTNSSTLLPACAVVTVSVLAAATSAIAGPPRPRPLECGPYTCTLHASPKAALLEVLRDKPSILAIGEVHQTEGTLAVRSAISRFTRDMLPALQHKASDLIAETWIAEGGCGEVEAESVEQIAEVTERPKETEDEVVTLLRRAKEHGMLPHILEVTCADYATLLDANRELDAEKLLTLVTRLLADKVQARHERNEGRGSKRMVVVYGGAIHNDTQPAEGAEAFSFGARLEALAGHGYVELDLYVPELIDQDPEYAEEPWFPHFRRHVSPKATLLIRLRRGAYVLAFPRSPAERRPRK